jgi:hypothetical protein
MFLELPSQQSQQQEPQQQPKGRVFVQTQVGEYKEQYRDRSGSAAVVYRARNLRVFIRKLFSEVLRAPWKVLKWASTPLLNFGKKLFQDPSVTGAAPHV